MSNGDWLIFFQRPIALTLIGIAAALLVMSAIGAMRKRADWRAKLAEVEAGD
jgi:TctA family transporter